MCVVEHRYSADKEECIWSFRRDISGRAKLFTSPATSAEPMHSSRLTTTPEPTSVLTPVPPLPWSPKNLPLRLSSTRKNDGPLSSGTTSPASRAPGHLPVRRRRLGSSSRRVEAVPRPHRDSPARRREADAADRLGVSAGTTGGAAGHWRRQEVLAVSERRRQQQDMELRGGTLDAV